VEVHPLVPPVSPVAPSTGASDCNSADKVEVSWNLPVTAVPQMPPATQQAGQPLIGNEQPAQAVDHQPTAPATGQPVKATRSAHPRCVSAVVRNPVHGSEGNRSKPKCRLRIPELRRTTCHRLSDDDNVKKRDARAQWQRQCEVANKSNGRNAAKARGQRSAEQKSAEHREQHRQQGTERRVRSSVPVIAPP
jgi:hypothetical protein